MDWIDALIMGLVQGLSEYLPISSSGHLEIFHQVLGLNLAPEASLEFDVALHVATVLSTLVVLWREFVPLCASFFTFKWDGRTRYVLKILLSCIPVGIVGVVFKKQIEGLFGGNLLVVGTCLLVTAALLSFAYFTRTRRQQLPDGTIADCGHDITWLDAFVIGIGQAIAVLPGLSRSGTTIATGILMGDKRAAVAQFSFFMVIIPILGQALLSVKDIVDGEAASTAAVGAIPLLVGFTAAFVSGCLACKWMIDLVKKGRLVWFALYCLLVGGMCLIYVL